MKKRIFAILMCVVLSSVLCVSALATGDIGIIGGADGDTQIILDDEIALYDDEYYELPDDAFYDDYYDFYEDEEFMSEIENNPILSIFANDDEALSMFYQIGLDNMGTIVICSVIATIFMFLFTPALVVMIIFAVLNSKTKKKIKEYEMRMSAPFAYAQPNFANLNYQPQPTAQPQVNQTPVLNGEPVNAENEEGGELK